MEQIFSNEIEPRRDYLQSSNTKENGTGSGLACMLAMNALSGLFCSFCGASMLALSSLFCSFCGARTTSSGFSFQSTQGLVCNRHV